MQRIENYKRANRIVKERVKERKKECGKRNIERWTAHLEACN